MSSEVEKLRALLAEAAPHLERLSALENAGRLYPSDPPVSAVCAAIAATLAEPVKPAGGLTEDQTVWVIRLCKAMQMWAEKSHGAYTIGIGTEHEEHFSPRELANRALKELGIKAQFAEPPPNKKRGK